VVHGNDAPSDRGKRSRLEVANSLGCINTTECNRGRKNSADRRRAGNEH